MPELPDIPPDRPVLIAGPTASGKSGLALRIAQADGGVIVNADALQVYDGWRILSARPSEEEMRRAPHRLYGHVDYRQAYSAGRWLRDVAAVLSEGARPIIVGGTGLYFMALTEGLADIPPTPTDVRAEADARLAASGLAALLGDLDPATLARIDTENPARVQRAWEVQRATGRGLAAWHATTPAPLLPLNQTCALLLDADRDWLNARIDRRFDAMIAAGALDEARAMQADWDPARLSSRAIGAAELIAHLSGRLSLDAAVAQAKLATRKYAKRQRTWFRSRMSGWHPLKLP